MGARGDRTLNAEMAAVAWTVGNGEQRLVGD